MAQTLQEGCSYSLITEEGNNEKRQVYFVKLTDSCLKAIEEFTGKFKSGSKMKSIIRFDAQRGVVTIPSTSIEKKFQFAISNVFTSDTNPLQECIRQCNWKSDKLLCYGPLEQKISIAATDDCYENTRNRMAQVDQERKDVRTKEIRLGSIKKGKKSRNKMVVEDKIPAIKSNKKLNSHNSQKHSSSSTIHVSPVVIPRQSPSKKSPIPDAKQSSPLIGDKQFTCRERVIHILSLRPHKKAELILRLQREAMSQKNRNNLAMVLKQVATHCDNQYTLLPHLFAELQLESWPFFSESEKLSVKRNIVSNKIVDYPSSQLVSSTSKSPEENLLKRSLQANTGQNVKKQKVEDSDEPSSTSISPSKLSDNDNLSVLSEFTLKENDLGAESPQTVASTSDSPEYLLSYKSITSKEQRFQYKLDFQLEYDEYLKLKKYLDEVASKFNELKSSLKRSKEGSREYIKIKGEILSAYNRQQQDEKYYRMKCRYEELQRKLSHIKRLVVEYDNHMGDSQQSSTTCPSVTFSKYQPRQ